MLYSRSSFPLPKSSSTDSTLTAWPRQLPNVPFRIHSSHRSLKNQLRPLPQTTSPTPKPITSFLQVQAPSLTVSSPGATYIKLRPLLSPPSSILSTPTTFVKTVEISDVHRPLAVDQHFVLKLPHQRRLFVSRLLSQVCVELLTNVWQSQNLHQSLRSCSPSYSSLASIYFEQQQVTHSHPVSVVGSL